MLVWCVNCLAEYPSRLTNFPVKTNLYATLSQHPFSIRVHWYPMAVSGLPILLPNVTVRFLATTYYPPVFAYSRREFPPGITNPAIRRLAYRGGVKGISGLIYERNLSKSALRMSSGTSSRIPSTRNGVQTDLHESIRCHAALKENCCCFGLCSQTFWLYPLCFWCMTALLLRYFDVLFTTEPTQP